MSGRDEYYNRAKQAGYRSRSAYKLRQLDDRVGLLAPGDVVVDLGAAPGGWLQVAAERVAPDGHVVGVDLQSIDPVEGADYAPVTTVRGDLTEAETQDRVRAAVRRGSDPDPATDDSIDDAPVRRPADVVLSDMAPNMTGEYEVDHARSVHLARTAFETARDLLEPGGDLVAKVFDGRDLDDLRAALDDAFESVSEVRPDASRDESAELYLVATGHVVVPVEAGEERTVAVVDTGDEGDGIAYVEDYTVFVPDATAGDEVRVRIDDVYPRYAFAERLD